MIFLATFLGSVGTFFTYIVPFLFVLTVVVFFHELGHFLVARWNGVKVSTFSIGFGKELFGFNDKHGTRWRFAIIPLGGYVKFIDDENPASKPDTEKFENMSATEKEGTFQSKTLGQKAAVVAAGPIANFILAIFIFTLMFTFLGERIVKPVVDSVQDNSPAAAAGFKKGDMITHIDGSAIGSFNALRRIVSVSGGMTLQVRVQRNGRELALPVTPKIKAVSDGFGGTHNVGLLGVGSRATKENTVFIRHNPVSAAWKGTQETYYIIERTLGFIKEIIVGRQSAKNLGGPGKIAYVSGKVAEHGIVALINLIALISVSIGLMNLFPIPVLDGGHLMYYAIEAVKGSPLSQKNQEFGFRIGMSLMLMLMLFVFWNDAVFLLGK